MQKEKESINNFNYEEVDAVKRFTGSHPAIMKNRIDELEWSVKIDEKQFKMGFKDRFLFVLERFFNKNIKSKNG